MIETKKIEDVTVISFPDLEKLNILVSQPIKKELTPYIEQPGAKLAINLEGIQYIDSSGFSVLPSILRASKEHSIHFKICNVNPEVMETIRLLKLDTILDIREDLNTCLESMKQM